MKRFLAVVLAAIVCCHAQQTLAEQESPEQQLRRQMEAIQSELEQLQSQTAGLIPSFPATPQDRVKLAVDSINRNYIGLKQSLYAGAAANVDEPIPVPHASRLSGFIEVRGAATESMHGWKPLELRYAVREEFIGYLITTRYFDTHTRKFTSERDYQIATISTDIQITTFGGRQCVKFSSGGCSEWASFAKWESDRSNIYPSIHDWVVLGSSDDGVVSVKLEAPDIYFSSADKRAGKGLGCYGTTLKMSTEDFAKSVRTLSLSETELIGKPGAPFDCDPGSSIEVSIDFCDKTKYADFNACRQVEHLLGSMRQSLALRDAYQRWGTSAENIDQLNRLVNQEISTDYPLIDLQDDNFLENYSGTYTRGAISIPDLCNKCIPRPLCQWEQEALQAHEENHAQLIALRADYNTLMNGTTLDKALLYPDAIELSRAEARALADMEYAAYTEQARYLNDIIQEQLHAIFDCSLSPDFLLEYPGLQQKLNSP